MTELELDWPPTPWWQEKQPRLGWGCRCGNRDGWASSGDNDWWVCSTCRQPSRMVLEKRDDVLNYFRYGPQHNLIITTHDLIHNRDIGAGSWIIEYTWTPEVIVGSETGRQARVWVHKSASASTASPAPTPTASGT